MILCCGEALIDMLPRETREGEPAFAPYPGGAVFNTAIALGRLGSTTGFLGGLSRDLFGDMLARGLAASGVDYSLSPRSARPTTLAFVTLNDGQAAYAFYDENTALRMLSPADLPDLPDQVQTLFFGGISLASTPCAETYAGLMIREAPRRICMIDPNIRPGFIRDEAAYRTRIGKMMAHADIVKLSDEDLRWLAGAGDPVAQARAVLARGPKIVVLTRGAAGATGILRGEEVFVPAPSVKVADTVGAGDTFNAGVLCALHRTGLLDKAALGDLGCAEVRRALNLGVHAAAVTVSRAGANPPHAHELTA